LRSNIFGIILAAVAFQLILDISPSLARAEAPDCTAAAIKVGNFAPTRPPRPAPLAPFMKDGTVRRTLADYQGQGVVLNLWATWCTPCVLEMSSLNRLHAEMAGTGIEVLALSQDFGGADAVRRFYLRRGIKHLDVLVDTGAKVFHALGAEGLPTTILVDAAGDEVGRILGPLEWDTPEALDFVRACLGGDR
jgi:peroxiredoxin